MLRFRRSIRIFPGLRINVGKRGASVSVGGRGAHVTVGRTGTRTTVGLPGTGLSYTHLDKPHQEAPGEAQPPVPEIPKRPWLLIALLVGAALIAAVIRSAPG
jgi:Protein of unknown function (DUF4236)